MSPASDPSLGVRLEPTRAGSPSPQRDGDAKLWLDGGVLACACPDCGAPMSIRLWLLVADCWRCGASYELTEEQEREAYRLLREATATTAKRVDTAQTTPAPQAPAARQTAPRPKQPVAQPAALPTPPKPRRVPAAQVYRTVQRARSGFHSLWENLPAWFVSFVVHAMALILAGLWLQDDGSHRRAMVLATAISPQDWLGEQGFVNDDPKAFEFDMPGAVEMLTSLDEMGMTADPTPALDPPIDIPSPMGELPERAKRVMLPLATLPAGKMYAGRNPQLRAQIVRQAGGTSFTEAAVARGLLFLARHQRPDGSWSLNHFNASRDCDATCTGAGRVESDVAATAMALLPFLGAGQTHQDGQHKQVVLRGLNYLCSRQRETGDLRGRGSGRMYAHGQAAIVLSESFALTGDEQLREPAQKALDFIVYAQHRQGGWRYEPREPGDTSVVGWQLMALESGRMASLLVPPTVLEGAGNYLDEAQCDQIGGRYGYRPGLVATPSMTAEALLCRQYLGWPRNHSGLESGVDYLVTDYPPDTSRPNIYYWYYATQVLHHYGGRPWEIWNDRMREVLVELQEVKGHAAGSWAPVGRGGVGGFADAGGRIYATALAICTLEVYYRHLPLYGEAIGAARDTP